MKKIFFLLLVVCAVPALAETISTVSYNPSRLGQYNKLKIAKKANFKGGLTATNLNVQNATLGWNEEGAQSYSITSVTDDDGNTGKIEMTSAAFQAPAGEDLTFTVFGGEAKFENGNSSVTKITHPLYEASQREYKTLRIFANEVVAHSLTITGKVSSDEISEGVRSDLNNLKYDNKEIDGWWQKLLDENFNESKTSKGFYLAGGNILYHEFGDDESLTWCKHQACGGENGQDCSEDKMRTVYLLGIECENK